MSTNALSETTWVRVLERIVADTSHDTTRTLARMLRDIIEAPDAIAEILDAYGRGLLLEPLP